MDDRFLEGYGPPKGARVIHVRRSPLPWRSPEQERTECGRTVATTGDDALFTADEAAQFVKEHGRQRASLFICMTCMTTTGRWDTWEQGPVARLRREVLRPAETFDDELRAIADLIARHAEEFAALRDGKLRFFRQKAAR